MIVYSYGGFALNDYKTYFAQGADASWTPVSPATAKIARLEGLRKTGETVDALTTPAMNIGVLSPDGTRAALDTALDALYVALDKRNQKIAFRSDGRYYLGDCITVQTPLDKINYAVVQATFMAYQPYAYAASASSFAVTQAMNGGNPYFITPVVTGVGGTKFARPTITILNSGANALSNFVIQNVTNNTFLNVSGVSVAAGDSLVISCDPINGGYLIYKLSVGSSVLYDFSGTFPILNLGSTTFRIQCSSSTQPTLTVTWAYTARYLA